MLLYTPEAEAVRAVLRDVFEWEHVEDTPGWLIFALPPSERRRPSVRRLDAASDLPDVRRPRADDG